MHLIKPGLRHQDLEGIHLPSFRFSWKLKIKPGLRHQDLEGIHLPSFRFSWKLKKLCRVDFFESWQTAEDVMVLPCDFTAVCHD
jgi:phage replication-related protein YjqB (UPF0714/DUF867 family)